MEKRNVHLSLAATLNIGDFSSVKITVGITEEFPVEPGETPSKARAKAVRLLYKDLVEIHNDTALKFKKSVTANLGGE